MRKTDASKSTTKKTGVGMILTDPERGGNTSNKNQTFLRWFKGVGRQILLFPIGFQWLLHKHPVFPLALLFFC